MIVRATSPSRLSLIGGGTDLPSFSDKYGGKVFNIAVNLQTHVQLYLGDNLHDISGNYLPHDASPDLFYKIRDHFKVNSMHFSLFKSQFDGFIKSGLGSSGSAGVALVGALVKATGRDMRREEIAELAWEIEVEKLGWYGGRQDQYASAFGGGNLFNFGKKIEIIPIKREKIDKLCSYIQLFYIGGSRNSSKIQQGLKELTEGQIEKLVAIKSLVERGLFSLEADDYEKFSHYVNQSWMLKKASNEGVTNEKVDKIYTLGIKNGAWAGKICGAGGSGYMFFISDYKYHKKIAKALLKENIEEIDFEPEYNGISTRIL